MALSIDETDVAPGSDYTFVDEAAELCAAHPDVRAFWDYRTRCVGQSGHPSRRLFDPTEIPRLLSRIWIVDWNEARGDFHYRLVGTRVVEAIGFDPTGRFVGEALADRSAANPGLLARFSETLRAGRATWRKGPARHWARMDHRQVENLMVPFVCDCERFEQLVCISVYE